MNQHKRYFSARYKKYFRYTFWVISIIFLGWYITCLPTQPFTNQHATLLLDRNGELLAARIAQDGQWRFEGTQNIPARFEKCLLEFEDRDFYQHPGVNPKGIARAINQNFRYKRIVSGGSTITMQVARIIRKNPKRTFREKLIEMLMATRLEIRYSKKEILRAYASHAPFGNNVVGLEAASWRYFGRDAAQLSWAESATLAVLPNAPGLIYPGKNHQRLLEKRNRLLKRLFDIQVLDSISYQLALNEPLPDKPLPLPQYTNHALTHLSHEGYRGKTIHSTLDRSLQEKTVQLLRRHQMSLEENNIHNGAILITSVKTGEILAYVGNTSAKGETHGNDVDCITAPRSTGSIIKPILYEKSLEEGLITPATLLLDVPSHFGSFSPKNFSKQFDGAVPANQALARSLNIPFVRLLNEYGLEKFHHDLKKLGLTTLNKDARHYGLSLILGGAEARMYDLNKIYTQMAQTLGAGYHPVSLIKQPPGSFIKPVLQNEDCIYATFEAMVEVNRPDEDGNWKAFTGSQKIAWKTGTSFGFRDAWAIGITPDYVVCVWIGNADGEGRPGLTGIKAAAPLLFQVFNQLPAKSNWFSKPTKGTQAIAVCRKSGYRATGLCEEVVQAQLPKSCLKTVGCPYHQLVHLNKQGNKRVDSECEEPMNMKHISWFVLPPIIEKYYQTNHPDYKTLPEFKPECKSKVAEKAIAILYPKPNCSIYVPLEIDGQRGRTVFEATHRNSHMKLYWHLDDEFLGETKDIHQLALYPASGKHKLLLLDENGIAMQVKFNVVEK